MRLWLRCRGTRKVIEKNLPEHEKRILAVKLNTDRRQLTDAQRVMVGKAIEPDYAERARLRMAEAGAKSSPGNPGTSDPPFQPRRTDPLRAWSENGFSRRPVG